MQRREYVLGTNHYVTTWNHINVLLYFFCLPQKKLVIQLYRPVLTCVLYMQHKTGHNSSIGGFSKQSVPEEACSNFTTRCYTAEANAVGIISVMIQKLVF